MKELLAPIILCFAFYDHAYLVAAECIEWVNPYSIDYFVDRVKEIPGVRNAYIDPDAYIEDDELVIVEVETPWP